MCAVMSVAMNPAVRCLGEKTFFCWLSFRKFGSRLKQVQEAYWCGGALLA